MKTTFEIESLLKRVTSQLKINLKVRFLGLKKEQFEKYS